MINTYDNDRFYDVHEVRTAHARHHVPTDAWRPASDSPSASNLWARVKAHGANPMGT